MATTIISPKWSFYNFSTIDEVVGCGFDPLGICMQVYEDSDVAFQFRLVTDTKAEADAICEDLTNSTLQMGIVKQCTDALLITFAQKTSRYRVNDNTILYNWSGGVPGFTSVIAIDECFHIKIIVNGTDQFCSGCLVRIGDDCYTAVLDYNNDDDAFDFDYCGGSLVGSSTDITCEPTIVTFSGKATLNIPYTTSLQEKYGLVPTIQTWIYDGTGNLVDMGIVVKFDTFPPTQLLFDFGGVSDGIIKLS